jgi:hypothetical protein
MAIQQPFGIIPKNKFHLITSEKSAIKYSVTPYCNTAYPNKTANCLHHINTRLLLV